MASARIAIDCLLPEVRNEMLALKPAALATTWKLPPPPRPCRVPPTLRLVSLQSGSLAAPVGDVGRQIELVGVAGAGQRHRHIVTDNAVRRAAADRSREPSSSVMVPPPDQLPAMPANGPDCAWPRSGRCRTKKEPAANQAARIRDGVSRQAGLIVGMLPIGRCTVRPLMPHSISPIRSCH